MTISRRDFLAQSALASLALTSEAERITKDHGAAESKGAADSKGATRAGAPKNTIICSANGFTYLDRGYEKLRGGADTLDAALAVVSGPEDDPNDDSVGLGGLPWSIFAHSALNKLWPSLPPIAPAMIAKGL